MSKVGDFSRDYVMMHKLTNGKDIAPTVQVGSISSFSIQDPPTASANAHLLQDLTTQANTDNSIQYSDLFYNEASSLLKQITGEESATGFSMSKVNGRVFTHLTSLEVRDNLLKLPVISTN